MKIAIEKSRYPVISELPYEIVERKGKGHPDYMIDQIVENFSRNLCKEYINKFGVVLHHNVDKGDVVGGLTQPEFNGGKLLKPILIFFSGRATDKFNGEKIPVKEIAINSAKEWISKNFRFLNPNEHVIYQVETKSGAASLKEVFKEIPKANDTSLGQGYAPMSQMEKIVYEVENYINSKKFKLRHPYTGEDVKVMGLRIKDNIELTIAVSFIDKFIKSVNDYFEKKEAVLEDIKNYLERRYNKDLQIFINMLDRKDRGINGLYLTVTGTSAECGDDGEVGRGNRTNGVIPYFRPLSIEAPAGKNPITHVGKIYNVLAYELANTIYEKNDVKEVYVKILSQIGRKINDPYFIHIDIAGKFEKNSIKKIVKEELDKINELSMKVIRGEIKLF